MDNPLTLPAPPDPVERIHALARDFAYGAVNRIWSTTVIADFTEGGRNNAKLVTLWGNDDLDSWLTEKWAEGFPSLDLLVAFGYFQPGDSGYGQQNYELMQKAFDLLARPAVAPSIFISYSRKVSSPFGLLIECRLKSAGASVFIDRSLDPGNEWHAQLEEKVRNATRFIALIGKGTLGSEHVANEMRWATKYNVLTIPIWQPGFDPNDPVFSTELRDFIMSRHSIRVLEESAEAYYNATEALLNHLGYSS
jgi:hypothetical protein